jgi:hypothetical protein
MIKFGVEYYTNDTYFFLKKRDSSIDLYYNVSSTLTEARTTDEFVQLPLSSEKNILTLVEKVMKSKKKFKKSDIKKIIDKISPEKEEIDELIDYDGSFANSKIPIHDPKMSPQKTMDQTIFSTRQAGNPVQRGYRVYYGESKEETITLGEEDLSGAFGYEDVSGMTYEDCVVYMKNELEVENAEERCATFGKSPKLDSKGQERLVEKKITEVQRQKMMGMLEDLLVGKSKDSDIQKKYKFNKVDDLPLLIRKNLKNLLKQLEKSGISKSEIIKLIRNEQ